MSFYKSVVFRSVHFAHVLFLIVHATTIVIAEMKDVLAGPEYLGINFDDEE